ncbi:MAG: hypothetical protein KME13_14860 [Myxacorys californica WJT36-NPBG1]|jgi:hypothetical protein|nr:hypothetical protein [Myxacorys californica WJT36-NPBG1]
MKRWILTFLIPLAMLQPSVLAQNEGDSNRPAQPQPTLTAPAIALPTLTLLKRTGQIQLQLVNCTWDCALAELLFPQSALTDRAELYFDNSALTPVNIVSSAVIVEGNLTNYQLPSQIPCQASNQSSCAAIALSENSKSLPANQISSLVLTFNRSNMPPDQYTGAVHLTLADQRNRLILPIDLSVRSGPLMPLLVLLFGIVLGRLIKYMEKRGEPQALALQEVNRLEADVALANPEDQKILVGMIAKTRKLVFREQLDPAKANATAIRNRLDVLIKLRSIETRLEERVEPLPEDVIEDAIATIAQARSRIAQEDDGKAKELLEQVSDLLDTIGIRGGEESEIRETVRAASANLEQNLKNPPILIKEPSRWERFRRFLVTLSGVSDQVRAEATYWVVRPVLSLILLAGLSLVGLNTLYVQNGATFGARPFPDYLGLILWGLSADVASRSLSSLQGQKE